MRKNTRCVRHSRKSGRPLSLPSCLLQISSIFELLVFGVISGLFSKYFPILFFVLCSPCQLLSFVLGHFMPNTKIFAGEFAAWGLTSIHQTDNR